VYVGQEMIDQINIAGSCTDGVLPQGGGLLDQSAWWFELRSILRSEERRIEDEQIKRERNRGRH
jgi:hypothetical protein